MINRILGPILILASAYLLTGCGSFYVDVDSAKHKFSRISDSRPLGSTCGPNDTASIKRADHHPLWPTGGWRNENENIAVDYSKTLKRNTNSLVLANGCISGYVKFDKPGYLQARSYDDYFGDVYCGWSPTKVPLKPTNDHVYVSLPLCAVGDGGLDQVFEVAFFPEGEKTGVLIFSSAHPSVEEPLSPVDTYRPDQLGNQYNFNERLAKDVIEAYLLRGDLESARSVTTRSIEILSSLRGSIEAPLKSTPARNEHRRDWNAMLKYKLGLSVGTPEFGRTLEDLKANLDGEKSDLTFVGFDKPMLSLYPWLNDRLSGKATPVPDVPPSRSHMSGYDTPMIAQYLKGEIPQEKFRDSSAPFWIGVKQYLDKDYAGATANFQKTLEKWGSEFNKACAAVLLQKIRQSKKPKSK